MAVTFEQRSHLRIAFLRLFYCFAKKFLKIVGFSSLIFTGGDENCNYVITRGDIESSISKFLTLMRT